MAYQQQQGTYQYDTQQYYAAAQTAAYPAYSSQTSSAQSAYVTPYTDQTASYTGYSTTASYAGQASVSNVNQSTAYQSTNSSYYQPSYTTGTSSATATSSTTQANTSYYSQPASQPTQSYDAYQAYYQASSAIPSADSAYQGQSYYAQTQPQTQGVANSASYSTSSGAATNTSSSSYTAYNNTYAYSTSQQQPSQTGSQNQYYDYTNYGSQTTNAAAATGTSYYDTSQYTTQKQTPSSYATVASNVDTQSQVWAGQNSAYNSSATYSQPQGQYSQPQSYGYSATSAAVPSQYSYNAGSEASSSEGSHFQANRNLSALAVPQNNQANRNARPNVNVGGYNQRDQYSNRSRQTQGYKQDANKGYTAYRSSSSGNQNSRAAPSIPSWQGHEAKKNEPFNRRGFEQRPASNNYQQTRQPQQQGRQPKFERKPPFQSSPNQSAQNTGSYPQQKNERFDRTQRSDYRGQKEEQGRFSGERRNAPDQRSSRRQGTFGQLKELQRSDVPAATFNQKRDHQGNFRGNQARESGRGSNDNLRPLNTSQAGQSKNQPIPNKSGYERNKSDPRGGGKQDQPRAHRQEKGMPPGPKQKAGPPERKPPIRNSQQSSEGGNKFPSDKKVDSGKLGMGPPNEKVRFRGPHPMVPRGPGPMSPRGRFPPPRFPGDEMPFMPRPFGPHGPFPPGERMFGPPMRGMGRFRGRPGGPRPRFPFPGLPPPWELDPPMFPGDLRPPPPYFDEFDDRFMEDEFDPGIPPHMLPPRKRRRSSGSPHRGDHMPPMGPGRRPGSPDHFMDMEGPFEFGPRGPPFRPFPPGNFHPMMPPKLPLKNAIPPFRGTKEAKAKKQKQEQQKTNKLDKSKVKEEKDFKFNCEVCDCGFPKESEFEEHNKLHEKCQVEGCGLEAIPAVLKNHVKQQHEADLPPVEWSRDEKDTKKWGEERKKKYPSAANIASKKEVEKEKERVGAVLTTKEFGKIKKKKMVSSEEEEEKVPEKQEAEEVEASRDGEDVDNKEKDEKDAEKGEEKNAEKDSETGDGKEGVKDDAEGEEVEEMWTEETTTNPEKDDAEQKTEEIQEVDGSPDEDNDGEAGTKTEADEVVKEVIYQPVKKEVIKRFKRDKSSKREPWRTSKPVQKIISKGGRHRRATLLEMLLAPEVRHERNMILQCVRHTVNKNFFEPKMEPVVEEKKDKQGKDDVKLEDIGKKRKLDTDEKEVLGGKEESGEVEDAKQSGKDATREEKDEDAERTAAEPVDEGGEKVEKEEKEESENYEAVKEESSKDDKSPDTVE
ncbi:Nuclear fragile X mental retardation-interacting protein 1 [Holothuria leucospilota]|uniref:Nuclear fragile X mental retardation-interacting protein 1 n=1 Tax=Holothuria leucospilota TaxID=206669 RepID=A0A9Q1BR15_HOLLE|nr:Nuclear fragile X mental retardation-interacting protein 1 [Holothuria leucospilota]